MNVSSEAHRFPCRKGIRFDKMNDQAARASVFSFDSEVNSTYSRESNSDGCQSLVCLIIDGLTSSISKLCLFSA